MNPQEKMPEQSIEDMKNLAVSGISEDWAQIDEQLVKDPNNSELLKWAAANLDNIDLRLCDLAASIFEASDMKLEQEVIEKLLSLMGREDADNPYPSFRAAAALAKRADFLNDQAMLLEIKGKLEEFDKDEDVGEIARKYIKDVKRVLKPEKVGEEENEEEPEMEDE